MGAILLCRKDKDISAEKALSLFRKKGFPDPVSFECGQWNIYAISKINRECKNHITFDGNTLVCAGTPVYKGLNYNESLHQLLADYCRHELHPEELLGQYTIFFCKEEKITILTDPLSTKHLFADSENKIISSSFLAVVFALREKVHINKLAVYEKLLTGFIMRPNTIIDEVRQISSIEWGKDAVNETGISFVQNAADFVSCDRKRISRKQCVQEQKQTLLEYFKKLNEYSSNGIDIGLSGGYDSRLALACMDVCFQNKLHIHTHSTENIHKKDTEVALKMAECVEHPCCIIPTNRLVNSVHLDETMKESVLYFDGRTSFAIGGCGEVYTLEYRKRSTENTPMTVTGIGGELYRNLFNTGFGRIRLGSFMRGKVFSRDFQKAIDSNIYERMSNAIIKQVGERLGIDVNKKNQKSIVHRYYCEIMMPDGQGNAIDAYNQLSCCVAPFLEPNIILRGYESIPFHGDGGDFEGSIIDSINHDLASIESAYGYPLNHRPFSIRVKELLRSIMPNDIWDRMGEIKKKASGEDSRTEKDLEIICQKSTAFQNALNRLFGFFPEIDFSYLIKNYEGNKRTVFLAMTLDLLAERIETDGQQSEVC